MHRKPPHPAGSGIREIETMTITPADIIADALRASANRRVTKTCEQIAGLYRLCAKHQARHCELLVDGSRSDRYIGLDDSGPYHTTEKTAVHCPIYDGELPACEADDDDMTTASYEMLADLLVEWGGKLCLRDGTELRDATPEEIAESWIVGGSGMIGVDIDDNGQLVDAYVEAAR